MDQIFYMNITALFFLAGAKIQNSAIWRKSMCQLKIFLVVVYELTWVPPAEETLSGTESAPKLNKPFPDTYMLIFFQLLVTTCVSYDDQIQYRSAELNLFEFQSQIFSWQHKFSSPILQISSWRQINFQLKPEFYFSQRQKL